MKLNSGKIINLPVETQSGQQLGRVESFNLETESQSVLEYLIKPSNLVAGLIKGDFIIPRGQVIDITNKKLIVEDNIVGGKNKSKKEKVKEKAIEGATMKEL